MASRNSLTHVAGAMDGATCKVSGCGIELTVAIVARIGGIGRGDVAVMAETAT